MYLSAENYFKFACACHRTSYLKMRERIETFEDSICVCITALFLPQTEYSVSKNKIISTWNTSTFIFDRSRLLLSTINVDVFGELIILFLLLLYTSGCLRSKNTVCFVFVKGVWRKNGCLCRKNYRNLSVHWTDKMQRF